MKLKARGNHVLLREVKEAPESTLVLPPNAKTGRGISSEVRRMEIVNFGEEVQWVGDFSIGSLVLIPAFMGTSFAIDDTFYSIVEEKDIPILIEE